MIAGHPYPEAFVIEEAKVLRYLLNPTSVDGASKGDLLLRFGFSRERPIELMSALAQHPSPETWTQAFQAPHGVKHYFDGPLLSPDGRNPLVRTVWQIDYDGDGQTARFITVRPRVGKHQPPA